MAPERNHFHVRRMAPFEEILSLHNAKGDFISQRTWSGLSPTRNPFHLKIWGLSFSVLGDVPNWDSGQTQSPSSIGI